MDEEGGDRAGGWGRRQQINQAAAGPHWQLCPLLLPLLLAASEGAEHTLAITLSL